MPEDLPDTPHPDGRDRYAVYALRYEKGQVVRRRVCETSQDGVVYAMETLMEEGEIERGDVIGLFNRQTRTWVINPFLTIH